MTANTWPDGTRKSFGNAFDPLAEMPCAVARDYPAVRQPGGFMIKPPKSIAIEPRGTGDKRSARMKASI